MDKQSHLTPRWRGLLGLAGIVLAGLFLLLSEFGPALDRDAAVKSALNGPSLAALFPKAEAFQYDPPAAGSYELPVIKPMPDSELVGSDGAAVKLSKLTDGRQSLIAFVYLNCADAEGCPLAMATLWQLHDASAQQPALREHLQLITISFDPSRDTPQALNAIVEAMQADQALAQKLSWRFLTGESRESLMPLLQAFGQPINTSQTPGKINHLLRLFLVDKQGMIRNIYGLGSIDPRLIMTDVATLLMQEQASH
ncbi:MAG: SCO family protein [Burkholderiaceae bacterium]